MWKKYAARGRGQHSAKSQNYTDNGLVNKWNGANQTNGDNDKDYRSGRSSSHESETVAVNSYIPEESTSLLSLVRSMNNGNYGQLKCLTGRGFRLSFAEAPNFNISRKTLTDEEKNAFDSGMGVRFLAVQSDPFAPGSQVDVKIVLPFDISGFITGIGDDVAALEESTTKEPYNWSDLRRVAAEDFFLREWKKHLYEGALEEGVEDVDDAEVHNIMDLKQHFHRKGSVEVLRISSHVLPRSACLVDVKASILHFFCRIKLPGHGRRIDSPGIIRLLREELLRSVLLLWDNLQGNSYDSVCGSVIPSSQRLLNYISFVHDQEWLRQNLPHAGLAAFVMNGAILPRASGNSDLPLNAISNKAANDFNCEAQAIPFQSPQSLECSFSLPCSKKTIVGMGLPRSALTLIGGGGFHGKSTLLRALEVGIYNHAPVDGRAFVVTDSTAVKVRAEDRRSVAGVDIESFITNLPLKKNTANFVTSEASGSTSQAANIMEALELGCQTLLFDEDTSAANLMYRDPLVQQLVPSSDEPITSLVERIPSLVRKSGVSVILVVGASGQYFHQADVVLVMRNYVVYDATEKAKQIAKKNYFSNEITKENEANHLPKQTSVEITPFFLKKNRRVDPSLTFTSLGELFSKQQAQMAFHRGSGYAARQNKIKVSCSSMQKIRMAMEEIDLSLIEQLVEEGQLQGIAQCLALCYDKGEGWVNKAQAEGFTPCARRDLLTLPTLSPSREILKTPLGKSTDFSRLIMQCEASLRNSRLELQTPSAYVPRGFTTMPRFMEIGAALNRLRTLRTL